MEKCKTDFMTYLTANLHPQWAVARCVFQYRLFRKECLTQDEAWLMGLYKQLIPDGTQIIYM